MKKVDLSYVDLSSVYDFIGDVVIVKQVESKLMAEKSTIKLIGVVDSGKNSSTSYLEHPLKYVVCGFGIGWMGKDDSRYGIDLKLGDVLYAKTSVTPVIFLHEGENYYVYNRYDLISKLR